MPTVGYADWVWTVVTAIAIKHLQTLVLLSCEVALGKVAVPAHWRGASPSPDGCASLLNTPYDAAYYPQ